MLMRFERNNMEISTERLRVEKVSSSVTIVRFNLTVQKVVRIFSFIFIMRVVLPEIVLNLISAQTQKKSTQEVKGKVKTRGYSSCPQILHSGLINVISVSLHISQSTG